LQRRRRGADVSVDGLARPPFVTDALFLRCDFSGDAETRDCIEFSAQFSLMQRSNSGMGAHPIPL